MYEYYKKKWSKAAADDWLAARQRDRGSYSAKNAKRLGARDGEEYDLGTAMDANTDDTITKIIAGAAIVSIISGLFFGVLQPLLAPPTFTGDDGTVYMKSADGSFRQNKNAQSYRARQPQTPVLGRRKDLSVVDDGQRHDGG